MGWGTTQKSGAKLVIFIIMAKFYGALVAVIFKKTIKNQCFVSFKHIFLTKK